MLMKDILDGVCLDIPCLTVHARRTRTIYCVDTFLFSSLQVGTMPMYFSEGHLQKVEQRVVLSTKHTKKGENGNGTCST